MFSTEPIVESAFDPLLTLDDQEMIQVPFDPSAEEGVGLLRLWAHQHRLTTAASVSYALQKAIKVEQNMRPATAAPATTVITQEIRYQLADAGEVFLVWGINGWQQVPESMRPKGTTVLKEGAMSSPMTREGDTFVAKVQVPSASIINYGLWITKTRGGEEIGVWDGNGYPPSGYQWVASGGRAAVVLGTINLTKAKAFASAPHIPFVAQKIRYEMTDAHEVYLVWGVNGWQAVPDVLRPKATTVSADGRMSTRMDREGNSFVAKVHVPHGTTIDYRFVIKRNGDEQVCEPDCVNGLHTVVKQYETIKIQSRFNPHD
jgi:hypothetical protein